MSSLALTQSLAALSETYKQTLALIQELQSFPGPSHLSLTTSANTPLDQQRLDLANECHDLLKSANDTLELLRQDIDTNPRRHSTTTNSTSDAQVEHDRNANTIARLTEDLSSARTAFRRAQLQSKRNLDATKRKEREQLFAQRRDPTSPTSTTTDSPTQTHVSSRGARSQHQSHLTQSEIERAAQLDVTRALRRSHALLTANLQQSRFAQQTLEESQEQLKSLGERYTGTSDLLKSSRGLVKTLISAQKSDSWYLKTSVYLLLVTLGWLLFRRLLFGPLWWFVWWPGKIVWYSVGGALGLAGGIGRGTANGSVVRSGTGTGLNVPTVPVAMRGEERWQNMPAKGAGWGNRQQPGEETPETIASMSRMIEDAEQQQYSVEDIAAEPEDHEARNTRKRMMEADIDEVKQHVRDEL